MVMCCASLKWHQNVCGQMVQILWGECCLPEASPPWSLVSIENEGQMIKERADCVQFDYQKRMAHPLGVNRPPSSPFYLLKTSQVKF